MMLGKCRFNHHFKLILYILSSFLMESICGDISLDYYYGSDESLRTPKFFSDCDTKLLIRCDKKCVNYDYACLAGHCYCVKLETIVFEEAVTPKPMTTLLDFQQVTPVPGPKWRYSNKFSNRPVLRHHIAHFCPNLDEARQCIRKCMETGKPAFCGKDHKCYCAHKYDAPYQDRPIDPEMIRNQYKDLYNHYFGTGKDTEAS